MQMLAAAKRHLLFLMMMSFAEDDLSASISVSRDERFAYAATGLASIMPRQ